MIPTSSAGCLSRQRPGWRHHDIPYGTQPGRPRKLDANQLAAARAALAADQSVDQVAAAFGVSRATLYRHLNVTEKGTL